VEGDLLERAYVDGYLLPTYLGNLVDVFVALHGLDGEAQLGLQLDSPAGLMALGAVHMGRVRKRWTNTLGLDCTGIEGLRERGRPR